VFHLFIWLLNRLGVDMEIHMASSALPVGDLSVRCETIVMNQTALKNSDQNVSQ